MWARARLVLAPRVRVQGQHAEAIEGEEAPGLALHRRDHAHGVHGGQQLTGGGVEDTQLGLADVELRAENLRAPPGAQEPDGEGQDRSDRETRDPHGDVHASA